jgi:hypothetical protein
MHPADAADLALIPQATQFIVSLFLGTGQFAKQQYRELHNARATGEHMAKTYNNGRKAAVYALLPDGRQIFVPESYQPEPAEAAPAAIATEPQPQQTEEPMSATTKTFGKRFNAQRAAKAALGKDAQEGVDFATTNTVGKWTWRRIDPKPAQTAANGKAPKVGKRAQIEADAKAGKLPTTPDFSAKTHERFRGKLAEVVKLAKAGDVKALKAFKVNPISSSPKAIDRYRNLAVMALEANR